MIINQFDATKGISIFEEEQLKTQFHAHPATEIVIAKTGTFSLTTKEKQLVDIQIGLIQPNVLHAFNGEDAVCEIIMLEREFIDNDKLLASLGEAMHKDGIIELNKELIPEIHSVLLEKWSAPNYQTTFDNRVEQTILLIKEKHAQSDLYLTDLAKAVNLSPSRLSHLFKAQMGIAIQKFIIWIRMKAATTYMLEESMHLTKAAYNAGFYDTAHFSKHFKEIFGIKPSLVYNKYLTSINSVFYECLFPLYSL